MVDRNIRVVLTASAASFQAALGQAAASAKTFGSNLSQSITKNEANLNKLSRGAGAVGLGLAAGIGYAVKSAADFDQAMSNVAATGQDAQNNITALRDAAIDMGAKTAFSAGEAAGGIEALEKAGVSAKDILGGGLKGSLDLAAAGTLGVSDAADIAATAMTQFGLAGKDVPHIADLLAAGAGKAQGSVQDMGEALKYVGPVAHQMGISIEETSGTIALLASNGILGSQAGTSLRGMLTALTSPSKQAAGTMKELGINVYDASGNFVGFKGVAEQLHKTMGGLTKAERDQALGRIFGNEQITAARILYAGGGASVSKWTKAVNESGFAARTAATKMNNLKGDIEQLKGSFETALIGLGEGSQAPLRKLTQGATDAVNAFIKLSPSSKSAVLSVGAIGAAGLLSVAGVAKLAVGINSAVTSFSSLRENSPRTAGALGAIGKASAIAAAALIGLQIAGAVERHFTKNFTPSVDEAAGALTKLASSPNANLDDKFQFHEGKQTTDNVNGLGEAFVRLGQNNFGDKLSEKFDKLKGTTDSVTGKIKLQFEALDQSIVSLSASGHSDQAAAAFKKIADQAAAAGTPVDNLVALFPQYAKSVRAAAESSGYTIKSTQELADIMAGKLPPALKKSIDGLTEVKVKAADIPAAMQAAEAALSGLARPAQLGKKAMDALTQSIFAEGNAALGLSDAHIGFEAAIDGATAALKRNGKTLSYNTEKGRENRQALNAIAAQGEAYVTSLVKQGASSRDVEKATEGARTAFIRAARQMGLSKTAAGKLADQYGLIPKNVSTDVKAAHVAEQASLIKAYQGALAKLPASVQTRIAAIYKRDGAQAALTEMKRLDQTTGKPKVEVQLGTSKQKTDAMRASLNGLPKSVQSRINAIFKRDGVDSALTALKKLGYTIVKPQIRTISDAKRVAAQADAFLKSVKDAKPKVLTQKDVTKAKEAEKYLKSIKNVKPGVLTQKDEKKAREAEKYLKSIKDVDPKVITQKDLTRAKQAEAYLKSIHNVDPKVITRKEMTAAEAAVRYLQHIRDVDPKVITKKDLTAAEAVTRYLRNIKDKTVNANIKFSTNAGHISASLRYIGAGRSTAGGLTAAEGGAILGNGRVQHKAAGGRVQDFSGKGERSYDTEPALLRVNEHVWTPEEVRAAGGHDAMFRMRKAALGGELHFANGGAVIRGLSEITPATSHAARKMAEAWATRFAKTMRGKLQTALDAKLRALAQEPLGTGGGAGGKGRVWPVPGRRTGTYPRHTGVDINRGSGWDDYGDPIRAVSSGTITHAGFGRGYGRAIFERAGSRLLVYGHTSKVRVRSGQFVRAGQLIGNVGNTGNSSAPHLHFEVRPGRTTSAALRYLRGYADGGPIVKTFDRGGILAPGATFALNKTRKPEFTFENQQFKSLNKVVRGLAAGGPAARSIVTNNYTAPPPPRYSSAVSPAVDVAALIAAARPVVENMTVQSTGNTHNDVEEVLFQLRSRQRGGVHR